MAILNMLFDKLTSNIYLIFIYQFEEIQLISCYYVVSSLI
jgi:hypothetical protein